jgi:predicted dehydrogenase
MYGSLLVGCGNRGGRHAAALARSEAFDLRAVCDLDAERAQATAEAHGVPSVYTDLGAALDAEAPDHVSCVFPPTVRLPVYREVLGAGPRSLVVEKPVANTRREAEQVADLAAESGAVTTVSHQHIYTAELQALKRWLDAGRLGDPERLTVTTRGFLLSMGTHLVHALNWLLSETPERVRGLASGPDRLHEETAEPEETLLALDYPGGTRAFLDIGDQAPGVEGVDSRWLETRFDVVGSAGRAEATLADGATLSASGDTERVSAADAAAAWFDDRPWDGFDYVEGWATDPLYRDQAAVLAGERERHPAGVGSAVVAHRAIEAGLRAQLEGRGIDPATAPPATGVGTEDRLRRHLVSRRRPAVVTSLLGADPFETAADLGCDAVAPDAVRSPGDTADALDRYGLSAPAVVGRGSGEVDGAVALADAVDAGVLVLELPPDEFPADELGRALDAAADPDLTVAVDPTGPVTVADLRAVCDAGARVRACLSPPRLVAAGESPVAALAELGGDVAAVRLWDTEPDVGPGAADADLAAVPDDSGVPGGGGAVDFGRLLETAVGEVPTARWLHWFPPGDRAPADRVDTLRRAVRFVERSRPAGY